MTFLRFFAMLVGWLSAEATFAQVSMSELDLLDGQELERQLVSSPNQDHGRLQVALGVFYTEQNLELADQYFALAETNLAENDLTGHAILAGGQCLAYMLKGEMNQALARCEHSVSVALAAQDNFALSKAHAALTQVYYQSGNLKQATQQARLALQAALPTRNSVLIATQHNNMGLMLQAQGDYKASMQSFRTGLDLIAGLVDEVIYFALTFNLGVSYADLDQHELALDLYQPALAWTQDKKLYRKELIVIVYTALSDIELGRAVRAEAALRAALARPELLANKGYLAFVQAALGAAEFSQNKLNQALASYEKGLRLAADNPNTFEQRRLDIGYAQVLAEVGRLDEATARLSAVLDQLETEGSRHFQRSALEVMLKITRATGDVEHSVVIFENLMKLQEQVQLYELEQELALSRAAYEVNSKERELAAAERDGIVRNGAIMLLLAVVVIGYLFISRRAEIQRHQVQEQIARQLEEEVDARTRELRDRMVEIEQSEGARREMERHLSEADKLRVLGQLTGGVAHDFNNLLTVVIGAAELLKLGVDAEKHDELVDHIITAANSGADITRALMAYARKQPLQLETVELNEFLHDRIPLIRRTMGGTITLTLNLGACPEVYVIIDPAQLTAALLNLALNARDAQDNLGEITISMQLRSVQQVEIAVRDTGVGMSREELQHAVEPFYTTKTEYQGNGLGLSMVYGFSKQSGGDLEIESELGRGTEVRLILPVCDSSTLATTADEFAGDRLTGLERQLDQMEVS